MERICRAEQLSSKRVATMHFGSPEEITRVGECEFFTNIRRGVRPEPHEIQTLYDNTSEWWEPHSKG